MRRKILLLVLALLLILPAAPAAAQDQPLVVFVLNPELGVSSVFNAGPDGISVLEEVFTGLGARTQVVNLVQAIPAQADVVVMIGPQQRLNIIALGRLWVHLARGNHLLMSLDPLGYGGNNSEDARGGLFSLISTNYGLITLDTFLSEPWFSKESVALLAGTYLQTYADVVPHPVVQPLIQYELPVQVWASRSLLIEPIGPDSYAVPLLYTESAYAESNPEAFSLAVDAPPLELNLGVDYVGRLNAAGLAEQTAVGSRIVILGDSQMVQNGYGLAQRPGLGLPQHVGNRIFAERMAAWLLGLPESEWPGLPEGYTWMMVDGVGSDWVFDDVPALSLERDADIAAAYNIRQVQAVRNGSYLYLLLDTYSRPADGLRVEISFDNGLNLAATTEQVIATNIGDSLPISDARLAVRSAVELRLPLRVIDAEAAISEICLLDGARSQAADRRDCVTDAIEVAVIDTIEPFDLRFPPGPMATITSIREVVVHERPASDSAAVVTLTTGQVVNVVGRSLAGDWLLVRSAGFSGWVLASLAITNADISRLPVVQS